MKPGRKSKLEKNVLSGNSVPPVAVPSYQLKYGCQWPEGMSEVEFELQIIQGLEKLGPESVPGSPGLSHHYQRAMQLLWPEDDHHRWFTLILETYLTERVTIVVGPKDAGKTAVAARIALVDYWAFPNETLWLVSSTEFRGSELRVWGEIKDLFNRARLACPFLKGIVNDSMHGIFTDEIGQHGAWGRDIRKGLIVIPCIGSQGEWKGLGRAVGMKQKRRRLLADELSFMDANYLLSLEHLDKGNFKMIGTGNPLGMGDPLDKLSEPAGGWGSEPESEKTEVWPNRWAGVTINLDGRDTPNNDNPNKQYSYLISKVDAQRTIKRYGMDSAAYWTQIVGKRKVGVDSRRVLTRKLCEQYGAFEPAIWQGTERTQVYGLDAAFGGDRAVGGGIEFGRDVKGQMVVQFHDPHIIPIQLSQPESAEDQLVIAVRADCKAQGIPPSHVYFDAGMRATLVTSFARLWSVEVNAVNFGGPATKRAVSDDEWTYDEKTQQRRRKRCDEQYSKFVTELWFTVRLLVVCRQAREFPESVLDEFALREWAIVSGNRYELETKEETKKRMGRSPDFGDWAATAVEGARRLGFPIELLMAEEDRGREAEDWLEKEWRRYHRLEQRKELSYE